MSSRPEQVFSHDALAPRAKCVARGLLKSGRIPRPPRGRAPVEELSIHVDGRPATKERLLRLDGVDVTYFLPFDGERLYRGPADDMVELQPTFVDMLARIGGEKVAA